ncbi:MAG: PPOX class F420-dependent oxidoreductase [Anaerolineae bacterium]|nr:PPOX class F420-dependent oxidoreductase [Anaerolineae bacterium]
MIPASHLDLIDGPYTAVLTTVMPDGQPQTTPVWCNRDGDDVLINTMREFRKAANMRANPRVTLLIYDPANPLRHVEIRGTVAEMSEHGAVEHLDQLTQLYMGNPNVHFFGDCVPASEAATHTPVRIRIAPHRVRVEG